VPQFSCHRQIRHTGLSTVRPVFCTVKGPASPQPCPPGSARVRCSRLASPGVVGCAAILINRRLSRCSSHPRRLVNPTQDNQESARRIRLSFVASCPPRSIPTPASAAPGAAVNFSVGPLPSKARIRWPRRHPTTRLLVRPMPRVHWPVRLPTTGVAEPHLRRRSDVRLLVTNLMFIAIR